MVEVVRREVDLLASRIREMRRMKRELETLLERADELRETEGERYCPLIPAHALATKS